MPGIMTWITRAMGRTAVESNDRQASCGGRLVAADGRELVLQGSSLAVDAGGGLARVVVEQRFANPHEEPLALVYQLPLPAEGAVSGFSFRIGEQHVVGEIDRVEAARRRFEDGILAGRTAALLEQERSSLFTQEIGNVPPRAEVIASITIDQRLRWLVEGAWEWRFPTAVAPRYLGAAGAVPDAERVTVDVLDGAAPAALALDLTVRDALAADARPTSPSHAIEATREADGQRARFAGERAPALDRDVVVRWPVACAAVGARLEVARPGAEARSFGLLTLVPPAHGAGVRPGARDLILLLDASGSMTGAPIAQARAVAQALVGSLDEGDSLEMLAFASDPLRFRPGAEPATAAVRAEALEWLAKIDAGGATEMRQAVAAALAPLRAGATRDVVLVTDGLIGFESEVVADVLRGLPRGSRLHTVGVGSAANRSLTAAAARAGRGVEVLIGLDEEAGSAAERLLAHVAAPLVGELEIRGSALRAQAPARLQDLTAGAPVLVALELDPAGGSLEIRGHGFERRIEVPAAAPATGRPALAALFGRERVEDLEMRACAGEAVDAEIEAAGLAFGIATRRTSWVAVAEEASVDPRRPTRRVRIAQQLPHGLSVEGLGLHRTLEVVACRMADPFLEGSETLSARRSALPRLRFGATPSRRGIRGSEPETRLGRIVSLRDAELVIEIEVGEAAIDWDPAPHAWLTLPRTQRMRATIDAARSTEPGRIAAGLVIRLVLRTDAPLAAAPTSVTIDAGFWSLTVELER